MGFPFESKSKQPAQRNDSPPTRRTARSHTPLHPVLHLQRTIGNQGVLGLLASQKIQRKCACGGRCPRCLQANMKIGQPGDKHVKEAGRVAEQAMRIPDDQIQRQREGRAVPAPSSAHDKNVARSSSGGGHPLPESVTFSFERQFGHAFSLVPEHADTDVIQRQCITGAACNPPICGNPGRFNCTESAAEAPARAVPQAPLRADDLEAIAAANGIPLTSVEGVFVDRDMSANTGAMLADCSDFITWPATAAPPAGEGCIFVPADLESEAQEFRTNRARSRIGGQRRAVWLSETLQILNHELAHEGFHESPPTATAGVGAGCANTTRLFHCSSSGEDFDVNFYLDELNAILSEFPVIFAHVRRRTRRGDYSALLHNLQRAFWDEVFNCDEGIKGILSTLRCAAGCSCSDVDEHVRATTLYAIANQPGGAWDATTRGVFQDLMNSMFPIVRYPRNAATP